MEDSPKAGDKTAANLAIWTKHGWHKGPIWHVSTDGRDTTDDGTEQHPYATIQHGVDAASVSDTVLVAPGTYTGEGNRDIDFGGKDIVLMSEDGPGTTIIDCNYEGRGFYLHSYESRAAVIKGFTIVHGSAGEGYYGSAVGGAGILCVSASPTIDGNLICFNCAVANGGGIYCQDAQPLITRNVISKNWSLFCEYEFGIGAGIYLDHSDADILGNTIVQNWAGNLFGAGGIALSNSVPRVENCIVAFNHPVDGPCYASPGTVVLRNCNLYHVGVPSGSTWTGPADQFGINGNVSADPLFCDTANGDYHLSGSSPCAPVNNGSGVLIGALDVACSLCGDFDNSGVVDIVDVVCYVNWMFSHGPAPVDEAAGDYNCDGRTNIADAVYLINYIFRAGPQPCAECK